MDKGGLCHPFFSLVSRQLTRYSAPMQQTRSYWNLIHRVMLAVLIIVVIIGIAIAFIPKVNQLHTYVERSEALQVELDMTEREEQRLKEYQHRFSTDSTFVERIAHEVGYAHKDETIFYFPEETDTNEL